MKTLKKHSLKVGDYFYFLKYPFVSSKEPFFKYLNLKKGSYIYNVFKNTYNYFFKNSINLYKDYKKFYKNEYDSFEKYLSSRHNLFKDEIDLLNNKHSFVKDTKFCTDRDITTLFYDETIVNVFNDFFGGDFSIVGKVGYED